MDERIKKGEKTILFRESFYFDKGDLREGREEERRKGS